MVNAYVAEVEQFYLGGANNAASQAGAALLMTGIKVLTGTATAGDQLADQVGAFGGQASAREFHKENIPVVGALGTHLGEASWNAYEKPSVETVSDLVATTAGAAELVFGAVQTYRSVGGPGAYKGSGASSKTSAEQKAQAAANTEGQISKVELDEAYPRVKPNKGLREEVWERSRSADGKVYDPSGVEIKPGDPWQMGHRPEHTFASAQKRAAREGWDSDTWKAYQRDPDTYRPELPRTNQSHTYEVEDW